jgi:EmrB/QacA subfamily drug resistance transporter
MLPMTEAKRKRWVLLAMSCSLALVFIDQTAISVALPVIQRSLNSSDTQIQWIINTYLLSVSIFVLLGGKLGDTMGHKQIFILGILLFLMASVGCSFAHSTHALLEARILQGIGGALMIPCSSALLINSFPNNERGKAMGMYVGIAAMFLSIGPWLGGILTHEFGWRSIFWINIPICILSVFLTLISVPTIKRTAKFKIDVLGFLLSAVIMASLVIYFMEGPNWGWLSQSSINLILTMIVASSLFILWEKKIEHPFIELGLFKNRVFILILMITLFAQTVGIAFVFWAIFLQNILHYSSMQAGVLLLPLTAPVMIIAPIAGRFRDTHGPRLAPLCGAILACGSLLWLGYVSHFQTYAWLLPGFLIYGIAMPAILSGTVATGLSAVTEQQRATASALINCARQLGISTGLAILSGVLSTLNNWRLETFIKHSPDALSKIPISSVDGLLSGTPQALQSMAHLTSHQMAKLYQVATDAYLHAFGYTMYTAALFMLLCLCFILKLPNRNQTYPTTLQEI